MGQMPSQQQRRLLPGARQRGEALAADPPRRARPQRAARGGPAAGTARGLRLALLRLYNRTSWHRARVSTSTMYMYCTVPEYRDVPNLRYQGH